MYGIGSSANPFRRTERQVRDVQRLDEATTVHPLHFRELASIIRRRCRLIITITVAGAMLATIVGLLIPPKYTAYVQLVVDPAQTALNAAPGATPSTMDENVDTHLSLLNSRDHLQRVAETLSREPKSATPSTPDAPTASRPGPAAPDDASIVAESGAEFLNRIARHLGVWTSALQGGGSAMAAHLEELERGVRVNQERRSRVISVAFTSTSPERAAALANRIAELYVRSQIEQRQEQAKREMARMDERIAELKNEAASAEVAAQKSIQHRLALRNAGGEAREADEQLRELERHAAASAQLHSGLLRRQKELRDRQEAIAPGVSIVSLAAAPARPSSHHPILFIFPALIIFMLGASFLAVALEQGDRGLRNERDVSDALGMSCIGLVPRLPRLQRAQPHRRMLKESSSPYAEAIRSTVATLQLAGPTRGPKVVVVSSSIPGEGKTTLAVSVAVYAAQLGRRVLLVDLDFRHPSISRALGCKADKGVADLLLHDLPPEEIIQRIPDLRLDCLPMRRCAIDPVALFACKRIQRLLRELRSRYDCVVVDSPPLLGVTEARLLASQADKVLFVVKWGSTRRELAQSAATLLRGQGKSVRHSVDLPVAVVTQVDLKKHARYRYGDVGESLVKYRKYYSQPIAGWHDFGANGGGSAMKH